MRPPKPCVTVVRDAIVALRTVMGNPSDRNAWRIADLSILDLNDHLSHCEDCEGDL